MTLQCLTLTLDGITAGDYLQWVRDPEPPALGLGLSSIEVRGEPLGDTVLAALWWDVPPPAAVDAGPAAGFPLTPEVVAIRPARSPRCPIERNAERGEEQHRKRERILECRRPHQRRQHYKCHEQ